MDKNISNQEQLTEFKKKICQECYSKVGCEKKNNKKVYMNCPKFTNFKLYGHPDSPAKSI